MTSRFGNIQVAKACVSNWFNGSNGLAKAYGFFNNKIGKWQWKPLIWKSCIIPKHRFILWLFAHGKLLIKDRQCYIDDKRCLMCSSEPESMKHLCFSCAISSQIWEAIRYWLGMDKIMKQPSAFLRAFRGIYKGSSVLAKARASSVAATVYFIWNARNRALFENETPLVDDIVRKIKIVIYRNHMIQSNPHDMPSS